MPRLSIRHLLLCTAICALLFSRARMLGMLNNSFSPLRAFSFIVTGAALTAAIVVIANCRSRSAWQFTNPGHWFALVAAWEFLGSAIVHRFLNYVTGSVDEHNVLVATVVTESLLDSVAFAGIAAILLIGLRVTNWQLYWRIPVVLHALDAITAVLWRLSFIGEDRGWFHTPPAIYFGSILAFAFATLLSLTIATSIDIYRKERRDWVHWVGLLYEFVHWYVIINAYILR